MEATITSKRLGALDAGQFDAALARFGLGKFIRAELVPFGLFGQNVIVTSAAGEFVLRGSPHFGDPEADLSRTSASYFDENPELAHEFVRTCLSAHPAKPGFGSRFRIFMLLDRMIIWEFVRRHEGEIPFGGITLRAWAGRYVDMLQNIAPELA